MSPQMKRCVYCGKENEDTAAFCLGCGTELTGTAESPPVSEVPRLNAARATLMLGIFLAAQFSVAAIVAVVGMSIAQVQGKNVLDPQQVSEVKESVMAAAVVL